jgi:hypothetical protein
MHGLDIGDVAYSVCYTHLVYLAPAAAQAWAPPRSRQLVNTATSHSTSSLPYLPLPPLQQSSNPQPNSSCFFCGGPHAIRTCSIAGDYLRAGRINRDGQYFTYPDWTQIRHMGNENLKQAIDARYALPALTTPATGSNAIPIEVPRHENTPPTTTISEIPESVFVTASYFLQCDPITESHVVAVTIEEEEDPQAGGVLAVTLSKMKAVPPSEDPIPFPVAPSPSKPTEAPVIESPKTPAFKYESKAAAPEAMQQIY